MYNLMGFPFENLNMISESGDVNFFTRQKKQNIIININCFWNLLNTCINKKVISKVGTFFGLTCIFQDN